MPGWGVIPTIRVSRHGGRARLLPRPARVHALSRGGEGEGNSALVRPGTRASCSRRRPTSTPMSTTVQSASGSALGVGERALNRGSRTWQPFDNERVQAAGVRIVDPLAERPWGQSEFTVEDHAGNWLTFWSMTDVHRVTTASRKAQPVAPMVEEAKLEETEHGALCHGAGTAGRAQRAGRALARRRGGAARTASSRAYVDFPQLGIHLVTLAPGDVDVDVPLGGRPGGLPGAVRRSAARRRGRGACAAAVGFRALSEAHEAHDRGVGSGRCLVLAVGARIDRSAPYWGGYTVDEAAAPARCGSGAGHDRSRRGSGATSHTAKPTRCRRDLAAGLS